MLWWVFDEVVCMHFKIINRGSMGEQFTYIG